MYISNRIASLIISSALLFPLTLTAQNGKIDFTKNLNYKQIATPTVLDNYLFSTFGASNKTAFNLKGYEIAKVGGQIVDLKINPTGTTYAIVFLDGKRNRLKIFDTYKAGNEVFDFGKILNPACVAYSADSRSLYVADLSSKIWKFDSKTFRSLDKFDSPIVPAKLAASKNGYFIAAHSGNELVVLNPESKAVRHSHSFGSAVTDFDFSDDSSLLAVLLANGDIEILNTTDFTNAVPTINRAGANAVSVHSDNKYIAVAKHGNEVELINTAAPTEGKSFTEPSGQISYVRFLKDGKDNTYLTFNSLNAIKYKLVKGFAPNHAKQLRQEVLARMDEWSKMVPGESEADYLARVNEDSRLSQAHLFEEEIATRMVDELAQNSAVTVGLYNSSNGTLTLEFNNIPPISLSVPEADVPAFKDASDIEFRDPLYSITTADYFELVYAKVHNRANGKDYEFKNRNRQTSGHSLATGQLVSIELVRQTGMDELRLTNIRNELVNRAKKGNLISDHTNIDASTNILNDVDATGRSITNYKVNVGYTVDAAFVAREDFAPGKYQVAQSNAASSMLQIVSQAFGADFAQYLKPGKKIIVKITCTADSKPMQGRMAYDGSLGEFVDEPYLLGNDLAAISLTKASGIRNNNQLAFARAVAVKNHLVSKLPALEQMNTEYNFCVEIPDKQGAADRHMSIEFTFVDAFERSAVIAGIKPHGHTKDIDLSRIKETVAQEQNTEKESKAKVGLTDLLSMANKTQDNKRQNTNTQTKTTQASNKPSASSPKKAATTAPKAASQPTQKQAVKKVPALGEKEEHKRVESDVDTNIPITNYKNDNTFAVIIANNDYKKVANVANADNDGRVFAEYCNKVLGIPQQHIRTHYNVTYGELLDAVEDIKSIAKAKRGNLDVILYYAGHGVPNEQTKSAYLLPVDADGKQLRLCYPLSELYSELDAMKANRTFVFLDACFSGATRSANNMLLSARGVAIDVDPDEVNGKLVVFSAATGNQSALSYDEQKHGLFTYFLLKRLKESKGDIDLGALSDYLMENVALESQLKNKKQQMPTVIVGTAYGQTNWKNMRLKR